MQVEVAGDTLFEMARNHLLEGKNLSESFHFFNLLLNDATTKNLDTLYFHLGAVCMKQGHNALSMLLLKEALKYRENFIEAINNIGFLHKKAHRHEDALQYFNQAIEIAEKFPAHVDNKQKAEYLTNIGSMYIANGTPLKALEYFNQSAAMDDNNLNKWNRSLAHLEIGDYQKGFDEYDAGERFDKVKNRNYGITDLPVWDGKPDKTKTVVVLGEQGLGDEIMFASMLPDLMKDCKVIFDAHPRLADLFRLNFPTIPVYGTRKTEKVTWPPFHHIDAVVGIGSLGKYYRRKKEDFPGTPYLKADPERYEKYRQKLAVMGDKPKIGISWKGGNLDTGRTHRCIPLEKWSAIFALEADFISLQYDKNINDKIKQFEQANNICLNHWQATVDDYDETAALVANLDLIISVPQSVIHLAGAMGVKTWQLVPYKALWQTGPYGENAPWYNSVQNFWQDENCLWEPVLKKVKDELCNLLAMSTEN